MHLQMNFISNQNKKNLAAITLEYLSRQWIISASEDTLIKVPLSGCRKVYETAIHKTTADNIVPLSMRDSGNDNVYIVSKQGTDYSAYWMGLFILNN